MCWENYTIRITLWTTDKGPLQTLRAQWTATSATSKDEITYITTIQDRFELLKELFREKEKKASHKLWHDKKPRHRSFQPGDLVFLRTTSLGPKLLAEWDGLYAVIDRVDETTYELSMPDLPRRRVKHHTNLRSSTPQQLLVLLQQNWRRTLQPYQRKERRSF